MNKAYPSLIELAVLGYCLWQASDLPSSWLTAPAERYAWIAFLIWCAPTIWLSITCIANDIPKQAQPILLGLAITASLIGTLGSLNLLRHIGLAFSIAGMVPFSLLAMLWLVTGISWLPALGWVVKGLPFVLIPFIQIGIASVGSIAMIMHLRRSCHA